MKSGDTNCLFSVNSNPDVPLDELLRNVMTALSPMKFVSSDTIYFEINNEYMEKYSSNFWSSELLQPVFLPQKVKVHLGGVLKVQATMKVYVPDGASSGGSPCLQIYVNDKLSGSVGAYKTSYTVDATDISVNSGDIISFALYGGITALNGGGVLRANRTYLQANSIKILGEVKDTRTEGKIEVSENG